MEGVSVAGATLTPHPHPNQDAFATWEAAECCGVVVADGLGSLTRSGEASRLAVEIVTDLLAEPANRPADAFTVAGRAIAAQLNGDGLATALSLRALGRTVEVAWIGNGAILQVCPVPWVAKGTTPPEATSKLVWANLVTPHIAFEDGRDRLSRVLGEPTDPEVDRIVIDITRPTVFLAVSDGLVSFEQTDIGRDDSGERWMHISRRLQGLLTAAGGLLEARSDSRSASTALSALLSELAATGQLGDDATVAAVVVDRPGGAP